MHSEFDHQHDRTVREEIETFRRKAEAFLAGEIPEDEFRPFRLKHGIYGQRQPGVQMVRCKIPGGLLTSRADWNSSRASPTSSAAASGHLTTRQNIQYHFVPLARVADLMHLLADVGLTNREACYNTVRNVTACPWAGIAPRRSLRRAPLRAASWPTPSCARISPATCRANSRSPSMAAPARIASRAPSTISACAPWSATAGADSAW